MAIPDNFPALGRLGVLDDTSYDDPDHYSEEDLNALNFVSERIAAAIDRIRSQRVTFWWGIRAEYET